ncbi:MAG: glucose-6-phosphate isomerase family protein, partial [Candidatus Methanofastidiosia archaeon]
MEFSLTQGKLEPSKKIVKKLQDMRDYFLDLKEFERFAKENPIVYEVYEHENSGEENLSFATTILYPGKVADEFFMTKGHHHEKKRGELYYGISGEGIVLIQKKDEIKKLNLKRDSLIYVPPGFAHRTINIGDEKLVFLAIYPSDAGHDY